MHGTRFLSLLLAACVLSTGCWGAVPAQADFRPSPPLPSPLRAKALTSAPRPVPPRRWWGVLYGGALTMARADEDAPAEENAPVEFVWPLWQALLRLLGL